MQPTTTTTTRSTPPVTSRGCVLAVLFAGAFVMGCAEMLVVGMIDLIAADLDVSVPAGCTGHRQRARARDRRPAAHIPDDTVRPTPC